MDVRCEYNPNECYECHDRATDTKDVFEYHGWHKYRVPVCPKHLTDPTFTSIDAVPPDTEPVWTSPEYVPLRQCPMCDGWTDKTDEELMARITPQDIEEVKDE